MKISPIDKIILRCIETVLLSKSSLVRVTPTMYDPQFMHLLGLKGIPLTRTLISETMNYLEDAGLIARVDIPSKYVGSEVVHYILTPKGSELL